MSVQSQFQSQLQEQHQDPGPAQGQEQDPASAQGDDGGEPAPAGKAPGKGAQSGKARPSIEERTARASRIVKAQKAVLTGAKDGAAPPPKPRGKTPSKDSAASAPAKPSGKSAPSTPATSPTAESSDGSDAQSSDAKLEAASAALEKLDFREAARILGKQSKALDEAQEKFHVIRRQRERLTKRETHLDSRQAKVEKQEIEQKQRYGEVDSIRTAYEGGNYLAMGKALERWCGDNFATITQKIARATAGFSKEKLAELERNDALERENRQLKQQRERDQQSAKQQTTRQQALAVIPEKIKGSPVLELEDGADLVLREMERNFDAASKSFRISFAQAAQRVLEREERRATKLGYSKAAVAAAAEAEAEDIDDEPEAPPVSRAPRPKPRVAPVAKPGQRTLRNGKVIPTLEERTERARRIMAQRRGVGS